MTEAPSLARKLGLKPGFRVAFANAPDGLAGLIGEANLRLARVVDDRAIDLDLALLFMRWAEALDREFPPLADRLSKAGMLWVAWPKKSSGVATDLTFDVVQHAGLTFGLVDTKICAIDDTWSGLKFVRRLKDR